MADCTSCQLCEKACPVSVTDQYQFGLIGRKAAFIVSAFTASCCYRQPELYTLWCLRKSLPYENDVDFTMKPEEMILHVRTVVVATGFNMFDPKKKCLVTDMANTKCDYRIANGTSAQLPYPSRSTPSFARAMVRCPTKLPMCFVSVHAISVGNPICSQICCMYSIKQAQLLMGALPMADVTIYYINIRSFGKGFEEFWKTGQRYGRQLREGKIGYQSQRKQNLILRYEDINEGRLREAEHDMVVLANGVLPNECEQYFRRRKVKLDAFNFVGTNRYAGQSCTYKRGRRICGR